MNGKVPLQIVFRDGEVGTRVSEWSFGRVGNEGRRESGIGEILDNSEYFTKFFTNFLFLV